MAHMHDASINIPRAPTYSDDEQLYLANVARLAISKGLEGEAIPEPNELPMPVPESLQGLRGVYITLMRHRRLRGALGMYKGLVPLYIGTARMAFAAAFGDRRFTPLDAAEWADMQIDISILGDMCPCTSMEQIVLGEHGLMLEKDGHTSLLLPQAPLDQLWDIPSFIASMYDKIDMVWDRSEPFTGTLWYFNTQTFSVRSLEK